MTSARSQTCSICQALLRRRLARTVLEINQQVNWFTPWQAGLTLPAPVLRDPRATRANSTEGTMPRQGRRIKSSAAVGILRNGQRETAHLRDYSQDGLCLDGVRGLMAGDIVKLHCRGSVITVETRWVRGARAGFCFLPDCAPSEKTRFLGGVSRGQKPAKAARIYGFSEMA
jgi:hypothetical protein